MTQLVRPLNQSTGPEWHIAWIKGATTTAYRGRVLAGTLKLASEDKAERETRCRQCMTSLGSTGPATSWQATVNRGRAKLRF